MGLTGTLSRLETQIVNSRWTLWQKTYLQNSLSYEDLGIKIKSSDHVEQILRTYGH